ncbi:MAG: trypsin-like peptidase domain-containing protein, partial [Holophagales bacterium]|nr:trypsin-like peptidase domain-containing protein [Holophagales bacterium]
PRSPRGTASMQILASFRARRQPVLMRTAFTLAAASACLALAASGTSRAEAQTAELPKASRAVDWASASFEGPRDLPQGKAARLLPALEKSFSEPGAPWLQIEFGRVELGRRSFLEISSTADGAVQRLDAETLGQWRNRSAYFNGDEVTVRLFAGPSDRDISLAVDRLVFGVRGRPAKSICGPTDDRVASTEPRVGRIDPIGCTGWIAENGALLTAGHCIDGPGNDILSFNPPPSLSDGTVQFPPPSDQYAINQSSFQFAAGGSGNDWGIFEVYNNAETGVQPISRQGSFPIRRDLGPTTFRITGFGVDTGTTNQTNQTHSGPAAGSSGTTLRYRADTRPGNSGSPVIDEATGDAVGIHGQGGCTSSGGANRGTSFFRATLWNALEDIHVVTPPEFPVSSTGRVQLTLSDTSYALCAAGGTSPYTSSGYCYVNHDGDDDTWELIANQAACDFLCLQSSQVCNAFSVREILLTGTSTYVLDDTAYRYCATAGAVPSNSNGYCYVNHDRDDDTWELFANQATWCNFVCARQGCPQVSSHREILLTGTSTYTVAGSSYRFCAIGGSIPNDACRVDFDGTDWLLEAQGATWCNFMCIRQ